MPKNGDVIWARHWGDRRPGVILSVLASGRYFVLFGSKAVQHEPHVTVKKDTRAWQKMGLSETTHFPAKPALIDPHEVEAPGPRCPPRVFFDLLELLVDCHRHVPGPEQCASGPPAMQRPAADASE